MIYCCLFDMSCGTLCNPMDYSTSVFPILHYLPEFIQTHIHWVDDAIQPSHPLSSPSPHTLNLSQHQSLFQNVSSLHQLAKVLELQLCISPSNVYSGFISFKSDWFDLLAVQGTLKSLLQQPTVKWSIVSSCIPLAFWITSWLFIYLSPICLIFAF